MTFACEICGASFATEAGLNMHKGHKHKVVSADKPAPKPRPGPAKEELATIVVSRDTADLLIDFALETLAKRVSK